VEHQENVTADPVWGERVPFEAPRRVTTASWSFLLEPAGLTAISFAGRELVAKLFFSVRDSAWGTPVLRITYRNGIDGDLEFSGTLAESGLSVGGTLRVGHDQLEVSYRATADRDVEIARIGPAVLHELESFGAGFHCDGPGAGPLVPTPQQVRIERVASGYNRHEFEHRGVAATLDLAGDTFEMEDQRNWGDATLKTYCPPLGGGPISLAAGSSLEYRVSLSAHVTGADPGVPVVTSANRIGPLPALGLAHSGGELPGEAVGLLRELELGYLHLLVELSDPHWRQRLDADLLAAEQLGVDAVLTVDVPGPDDSDGGVDALGALANACRGRASSAFVFENGTSETSDEIALRASSAFSDSGIAVGGGSRAHFASIASAGRVPGPVTVVAIPLAVASHDDDRRTLAESPNSFGAIVREARLLSGDRELLVGPVGFRPTFDPWQPPGAPRDLRGDWMAGHPRDGSVFAAAWTIAALGALAEAGIRRVTIGATTGARGALALDGATITRRPVFDALREAARFQGTPVGRLVPAERVAGFGSATRTLLGDMTDEAPVVLSANLQA
jgi:hypothetical protein